MIVDLFVGIGLVSMFWLLMDKYNLMDRIYISLIKAVKWMPPTVCVICVSFWLLLVYFFVKGDHWVWAILHALACTPFVLELTKGIWQK